MPTRAESSPCPPVLMSSSYPSRIPRRSAHHLLRYDALREGIGVASTRPSAAPLPKYRAAFSVNRSCSADAARVHLLVEPVAVAEGADLVPPLPSGGRGGRRDRGRWSDRQAS